MIDRKKLFADLGKKAPKADDAEIEVEGADDADEGDDLAPYRQFLAAVKANDPDALKAAFEEITGE